MQIEHATVSALGDRLENQDRAEVLVTEEAALMMVFDGMGGHSDGAKAADIGMQVVRDMFKQTHLPVFDAPGFLYAALARAHDTVVEFGQDLPVDFRPRATGAVCLVQEGGSFWGHIGDSRIYQLRDGQVLDRSRDHSHVEVLIQEGAITEEEALDHPMRNFVECCIGGDATVPDMSITGKQPLVAGDVLVVCSDGLWSGVTDAVMAEITRADKDALADELNTLSLEAISATAPYSDNTTAVALRWLGD